MQSVTTAFEQHRDVLRSYIGRRIGDRNDVDDVLQEAFVRFLTSSGQKDIAAPLNYLRRIVRNLLIDRARRTSPLTRAVHIDALPDGWLATSADQEHGRLLADFRQAYESALGELPQRCRDVFVLRRHHDVPTAAVAARLRVTDRMVQKYMGRAIGHLEQRLRPALTGEYHPCPDPVVRWQSTARPQ